MSYRKHPTKGEGHWIIYIQGDFISKKGKQVKQKTESFQGTEAEAAALDAEFNGKQVNTPYPTIISILPRFLEKYKNNKQDNSYKSMEAALKHLLPHYREQRIPLLTSFTHEQYKTKRLADKYLPGKHGQPSSQDTPEEAAKRRPVAKNSINRELNCLLAILSYAEKEKIAIGAKPELFPRKQATSKAIIPLSLTEVMGLLKHLTGERLTLAMLMFWGGLRKDEATNLKWEQVDIQNGIMMISGKGGDILPVPILGDLTAYLQKIIPEPASGYLALNPATKKPFGNIFKSLRTAAKKAGITKHIDHHLLRHTCGTTLMIAGAQQRSVQGILRHASGKTTERYTHLAAQFLQSEGNKMAKMAAEITEINFDSKAPIHADSQTRARHS